MPRAAFDSQARLIANFDIIVGLFNLVSFVCGIIALVSTSRDGPPAHGDDDYCVAAPGGRPTASASAPMPNPMLERTLPTLQG
jgi:hypothetical protein